jgi:hypothetical protein
VDGAPSLQERDLWDQEESHGYWAMPAWLFVIPLMGDGLAEAALRWRWPRIWAGCAMAILGLTWALLVSDAAHRLGRRGVAQDFPQGGSDA